MSALASLPAKRITCELANLPLAQSTVVRDFSEEISLPSKLVKGLAKLVRRQTVMREPSLLTASSYDTCASGVLAKLTQADCAVGT